MRPPSRYKAIVMAPSGKVKIAVHLPGGREHTTMVAIRLRNVAPSRHHAGDTVKDKLLDICQGLSAEYAEVRVHEGSATSIAYAGKELEDIGERTGLGGCVRVLKDGGWGFTTFNDLSQIEKFAKLALKQAELVGGEHVGADLRAHRVPGGKI